MYIDFLFPYSKVCQYSEMMFCGNIVLENWFQLLLIGAITFCIIRFFNWRAHSQELGNADQEQPETQAQYPEKDSGLKPALTVETFRPYAGATKCFPGGVDAFFAMMSDRRSIRHFHQKKVDMRIVEKCIQTAGTSPSGAHCEPWTYCAVTSMALKQQIREIVEKEELLNYERRMHRQWTADLTPLRTNHIKEYLTSAPCLILAFKQVYGVRPDGSRREHYYNEISTSISIGILLCALQAAGLSALVTTPLNCGPALRILLNRPQNEKLLVLLPVGYPTEDCSVPDLERKNLTEIMVKYD